MAEIKAFKPRELASVAALEARENARAWVERIQGCIGENLVDDLGLGELEETDYHFDAFLENLAEQQETACKGAKVEREQSWKQWSIKAFDVGAAAAHAYTKTREQ